MPNVTCNVDSPQYQIPVGAEREPGNWQAQNEAADLEKAHAPSETPTFL